MKISSAAIKDGNFEDKYGAKGTDFANKLPALSIPFEISEVPITAESFVVILKRRQCHSDYGTTMDALVHCQLERIENSGRCQPQRRKFYSRQKQLELSGIRRNDAAGSPSPL